MLFVKLGLLTCAFYCVLIILFEAAIWAVAYYHGFGFFWSGKHWFWTLGLRLGVIFGTLWLMAFSAAWYIVSLGLKKQFPSL